MHPKQAMHPNQDPHPEVPTPAQAGRRGGRGTAMTRSALALAAVVATATALGSVPLPANAEATATAGRWNFEADQPGAVPQGCTGSEVSPTVSEERAHGGERSLLLPATTNPGEASLTCTSAPQQGGTLSLWVHPDAATGFTVGLFGNTTTSQAPGTSVAQVSVGADGALSWSDRVRTLSIADAGTVQAGRWSRLTIGMTTDQDAIHLKVDGREVGSAGPAKIDPITTVSGFTLGSGAGEGSVFVDDVELGPAQPNLPRESLTQYRMGEKQVIAKDDEVIQMPSMAVRVPGPADVDGNRGERIIAMFPAHDDSGVSGGNELVASDDGGRTWQDFQEHNPLPDASSMIITKRHDGSLLAQNFHVYATGDPRKAMVETAVSTDNGITWTKREGTLSAPVDMAPYDCERPTGCNFVMQVHAAVEGDDGTLYQSAYAKYVGDPKYRQLLLTSTDGGLNWEVRSTVAYDPNLLPDKGYEGPCEGVLVRTGEHGLLMVMRTGSYLPMYSARSDDDGRTWSEPERLRTVEDNPVLSVYPGLERLADGSLLLLAGRPGLSLLRSTDDGATWSEPVWADWNNSANGTLLPMGGNTVMLFGDQGANWQHPAEYGIWNRTIEVLRRR